MVKSYTKAGLYYEINTLRNRLGIKQNEYGFDIINYCMKNDILVEAVPFATKGLRGMACVGNEYEKDVILLNSKRDSIEQNFDCCHEVVHLGIHRYLGKKTFNCIDRVYAKQDEYLEWQANEGAAELFMPYYLIVQYVGSRYRELETSKDISKLKTQISSIFNVTKTVVEIRLESLKYEIKQYAFGVPLNDIEVLSASQQRERNINVKSINEMEKWFYKDEQKPQNYFINFNTLF